MGGGEEEVETSTKNKNPTLRMWGNINSGLKIKAGLNIKPGLKIQIWDMAHMGWGPYGPGPIWARAIWAGAHMGPGPLGPGPFLVGRRPHQKTHLKKIVKLCIFGGF